MSSTDNHYYIVTAKRHQRDEQRYLTSASELLSEAYEVDNWHYDEMTKGAVIDMYGSLEADEVPGELLDKLKQSDVVIDLQNSSAIQEYMLPKDAPSEIEWAIEELGHDYYYFYAEPVSVEVALNFNR